MSVFSDYGKGITGVVTCVVQGYHRPQSLILTQRSIPDSEPTIAAPIPLAALSPITSMSGEASGRSIRNTGMNSSLRVTDDQSSSPVSPAR